MSEMTTLEVMQNATAKLDHLLKESKALETEMELLLEQALVLLKETRELIAKS